MSQVKFSIIVVCLNPGRKLTDTIGSIINQRYKNIEIIIKDGGSSDGSLEGLPEDERILVLSKKDKGIYDAMNQAIEKASGDWVYFLNCGDLFFDYGVLETVSKYGGQKEKTILYGDIMDCLRKERVPSNPRMDGFACYRNVPCHQACFYTADLLKEKAFTLEYKVRADYEHFLWCFFQKKAACIYLPLIVASYEGGGFSETPENAKKSAAEHSVITAIYMSKTQRFLYRFFLVVTLSGLRKHMANSEKTAHLYHKVKTLLYKKR